MKPKRRVKREKWWAAFSPGGVVMSPIVRTEQLAKWHWTGKHTESITETEERWQVLWGQRFSVRPVIVEYEIPDKGKEK